MPEIVTLYRKLTIGGVFQVSWDFSFMLEIVLMEKPGSNFVSSDARQGSLIWSIEENRVKAY